MMTLDCHIPLSSSSRISYRAGVAISRVRVFKSDAKMSSESVGQCQSAEEQDSRQTVSRMVSISLFHSTFFFVK